MTRRKRWFYYSIAILAGLSLAYIAFVLFFLDFVVDIWWFHALDYGIYFWMRLLYRFVIFIVAILIFSGIFFMNFWVGARYLGKTDIPSHPHEPKKFRKTYKQLIQMFRTGSMVVYTPLSLILGLTVSLPFFSRWHQALLWVLGPDAGQTDPVYGPAQISALIEQDTEISQKFTLWDQIGSEIQRGKMIILPINNVVYYIQPVYLRAARHLKIPELKKIIVSQGDVVVMDTTLERAFERLKQKIEQRLKRLEIPETKVSIKEPN